MRERPRLLILSAVHPFPRTSGQQQRVYYKLRALRDQFHLTFLTIADLGEAESVQQKLLELCDEAIVLPSAYTRSRLSHALHKILGSLYVLLTGLKFSNYLAGKVEFSTARLMSILKDHHFDAVLFEYWHAHEAAGWFRSGGARTILDMHDILWRSYARQLDAKPYLSSWLKDWMRRRYQAREESAWNDFDMLIAINQEELEYVRQHIRPGIVSFYAPMGTDISAWTYCWQPALSPRRIAYYGSLGSSHNQQDALLCYREIMPLIWVQYPDLEFWIVGSNPPGFIKELASDRRVHVTGFVEEPKDVLKHMSLVLCPWSGTYGFRSRVVEVMALGVPVIASDDAVQGMGFESGRGIFLGRSPVDMAICSLDLLHDEVELAGQSRLARRQMEEKFSYDVTYLRLSNELAAQLC